MKHSLENARNAEKRAATITREVASLKFELEAALQERGNDKAEVFEVVEVFWKMPDFALAADKPYLAKLIKIYGDLVTQIRENFRLTKLRGFRRSLIFESGRLRKIWLRRPRHRKNRAVPVDPPTMRMPWTPRWRYSLSLRLCN